MNLDIFKQFAKILAAFKNIKKFPKAVIIHGVQAFLFLFAVGTFLFTLNHTSSRFDSYLEVVSTSLIKTSFLVLAEFVIGGLVIDYVFKK